MKRNGLMTGALILSIGGVLAKIFSAIYRIVITRILGGVGIGLYQLVFPLYSLCVVVSTAGLPMAISKVVAKNPGKEKSIVKKCLLFTCLISLVLSFVLIIFSKSLAVLQGDASISVCYIILAPTIILVSSSAVLRGYFQGKHNFIPTAISNILEQLAKLVFGLILSLILIQFGILYSIIGAMVAIVISEILSLLVLVFSYYKDKKKHKTAREKVDLSIKELFKDILPITVTNVILPIATFIDSLLVVNLLTINFTKEMAVFMYGLESGAVASLVGIPTIFSFAIASVILPSITQINKPFNRNNKISLGVKIILLIAVPCVLAFVLIPDRLIECLYSNKLNGFGVGGLNIAYRLLSISGIGVVFLAVSQLYTSCLQAIDKRMITIRNLLIAVGVKFFVELIFMPSKVINIYALAIANTLCYFTVMLLNHLEIREDFKLKLNLLFAGKLALASSVMIVVLIVVLSLGYGWANTILAILLAGISYLLTLYFVKIFSRKDLAGLKYKT